MMQDVPADAARLEPSHNGRQHPKVDNNVADTPGSWYRALSSMCCSSTVAFLLHVNRPSQYATSETATTWKPLNTLHGISRHKRGHWQHALDMAQAHPAVERYDDH